MKHERRIESDAMTRWRRRVSADWNWYRTAVLGHYSKASMRDEIRAGIRWIRFLERTGR